MIFADQSVYNRLLQKVIHKGWYLLINYIKIFQNDKTSVILVGISYSKEQLMHNLLDNF